MKNLMMVLVLLMATHASEVLASEVSASEVSGPAVTQENPNIVSAACVLKVSHNLRKLYTITKRAIKKMDDQNKADFKKYGEATVHGMNERAQAHLLLELNDSLVTFAEGKEEVLKNDLIKQLCDNDLNPLYMYKDY